MGGGSHGFSPAQKTWPDPKKPHRKAEEKRKKHHCDPCKGITKGVAEGSLDIHEFKELKNPLVPRKAGLEQQIVALEKSKTNRLEPLRNLILAANQAQQWVSEDNWLEMKSFLGRVGSNRLLRAQTLTVSFKKPWNCLAETTVSARSATDVSQQSSNWWSRGESNP